MATKEAVLTSTHATNTFLPMTVGALVNKLHRGDEDSCRRQQEIGQLPFQGEQAPQRAVYRLSAPPLLFLSPAHSF